MMRDDQSSTLKYLKHLIVVICQQDCWQMAATMLTDANIVAGKCQQLYNSRSSDP